MSNEIYKKFSMSFLGQGIDDMDCTPAVKKILDDCYKALIDGTRAMVMIESIYLVFFGATSLPEIVWNASTNVTEFERLYEAIEGNEDKKYVSVMLVVKDTYRKKLIGQLAMQF